MKKITKTRRASPKEHWFSSDRPIESARADVLGRSAFAARLATSIGAWDGNDSLVIALNGGWGAGKTSVKNMVLEKLRCSPSRCPRIVEFSPWQVSGTGTLVDTFFRELGIALDVDQKRKTGLGETLSSYAKHLGFLSHVLQPVGAVFSLVEPVTGALISAGAAGLEQTAQTIQAGAEASQAGNVAKAKSLSDLKRDLGTSLASLDRPILIVIDDIDRLTTEEILQVFQLVKVNADFPNLVYLLLFERSIVEKALDQISGSRGHEFLQKIVQVEFHVPQAHRESIERALFAGLNRVIEDEAIKPLFDQRRWRSLYVEGIARYFQNLRHVYRFLGSLMFNAAQFRSGKSFETNPVDLIGLEALRVFEPGLYEQLPSAQRILTRHEGRELFGKITNEEVEAGIGQLMTHVSPERQNQAKSILNLLFPPISRSFGDDDGVSRYQQQWLREHRVCHPALFEKVFAFGVGGGDITQAELDRLLFLTRDRNGFVEMCRSLLGRGLIKIAFERLEAYKEEIPIENMPAMIRALCDLADDFPEPDPGFFPIDCGNYAYRLVFFGLQRESDEARRLMVLRDAFHDTNGSTLPLTLVLNDERTNEREQSGQSFLVGEPGLKELKALWIDKTKAAAAQPEFWNCRKLQKILFWWLEWGDKNEIGTYLASHVQAATGALWLLKILLQISTSTGTKGTTIRRYITLSFIERFFDVNQLEHLTSGLKMEEQDDDGKMALLEFRKALTRRAEGRPDSDWHRDR